MTNRITGKKALSKVLSIESNIDIIEKWIYNNTSDEKEYKKVIYQTIGDIINKNKLKDILNNIKEHKIGYEHPFYEDISVKIKEQNEFIKNPFINIEKGVISCNLCKSERVFSYSKQTRSGDESTTVFCECVECSAKWTIN